MYHGKFFKSVVCHNCTNSVIIARSDLIIARKKTIIAPKSRVIASSSYYWKKHFCIVAPTN